MPEIQATVRDLRGVAAIHFEKEEGIFYPKLRACLPDLIAEMDQQHAHIRELEEHVAEILSDPPPAPGARWLDDLRVSGIRYHDLIQHHIVDEEDHLPRLAERELTAVDQARLAAEMTRGGAR